MSKAFKKKKRHCAVRKSPIHGRGVFALARIPKKTRIIEYKGELITDAEADRRYSRIHENSPHTMLFSVDGGLVIVFLKIETSFSGAPPPVNAS